MQLFYIEERTREKYLRRLEEKSEIGVTIAYFGDISVYPRGLFPLQPNAIHFINGRTHVEADHSSLDRAKGAASMFLHGSREPRTSGPL